MNDHTSERASGALSTLHFLTCAYADLPLSSVANGAEAWVTDGRSTGEGAAAGTGCKAYAKNIAGVVTWHNYFDDGVVQV